MCWTYFPSTDIVLPRGDIQDDDGNDAQTVDKAGKLNHIFIVAQPHDIMYDRGTVGTFIRSQVCQVLKYVTWS